MTNNCQSQVLSLCMARPYKKITVGKPDQVELKSWLRRRNIPYSLATRARVVLSSGQGLSVVEVARKVGLSPGAVYRWRQRYEREGVAGLRDRARPGQPRKLSPKKAQRILQDTVHSIPREATHWSLRLMAKYAGVTVHQVRQVWKAADLRPHRIKTFKISNDPDFAEKVVDVVGLYMNPPDNAAVLSVDEKTQVQALDRTQPTLPMRQGQIERRTHDYKRHGTASLYAAFDISSGEVIGRITKRHRAKEFVAFLRQIDQAVEPQLDVHLIIDNSGTHTTDEIQRWLAKRPRFHLHFTPTSASWLNAVETWFSQLTRRALQRNAFTSVEALRKEIRRYIQVHNQDLAKPFRWTKSAASILQKVDKVKAEG